MEITNAQYTAEGSINALVDGVQMSIPNDPGNRHYAAMVEQGIEPAPYVEPQLSLEEKRARASMSRAKFAIAAHDAGLITEQEAEDWAGGTAIPAWVSETIDGAIEAGHIPSEERLPVRVTVRTQETINRTDRLIPILAQSAGLTPEQVDDLFGIA